MSPSLHKRYEIVFLAKNKYSRQFGSSKIAKIVKCNRKTVTHWLNRWKETKDLSDHSLLKEHFKSFFNELSRDSLPAIFSFFPITFELTQPQ
jgi:hypothetical protein